MGSVSLLLGSIVLLILGVVGLSLSLWGRREHPEGHAGWCRRCRYPATGGAATCPECGADLTSPRGVRRTLARPLRAGVVLSGLVLLMGLAGVGVRVYFSASQTDPRTIMPLWMLSYVADSEDQDAFLAREEIRTRYEAGALNREQTIGCVERAMSRVQTLSRTWNEHDAMLIERAWLAGDVSDERMTAFMDAAWDRYCTFTMRTASREGRWIPYQLQFTRFKARTFGAGDPPRHLRITYHGLNPEILAYKMFQPYSNTMPEWSMLGMGFRGSGPGVVTNLPVGEHDLWCDIEFAWEFDDVPRLTWKRRYHERVTILPKDAVQTRAVPDESLRQAIRDAVLLEFQRVRVEVQPSNYVDLGSHTGYVGLRQVPTPVAFDVFYRFGGQDLRKGTLYRMPTDAHGLMPMSQVGNSYGHLKQILPAGTTSIDVILRSNPQIMDGLVEVVPEIWGGEIVFENVPVSLEPLDRGR